MMTMGLNVKHVLMDLNCRDFEEKDTANGTFVYTNCPLAQIPGTHKHAFDENPSLCVRPVSPYWCRCWSCGFSGSLYMLIKQLYDNGNIDAELLRVVKEASFDDSKGTYNPNLRTKVGIEKRDSYTKDFSAEYFMETTELTKEVRTWLNNEKGCNDEAVATWAVRQCRGSTVTFPVFSRVPGADEPIIVGAWARNAFPIKAAKSKYYAHYTPFNASKFLYGEHLMKKGLPLIVFEGILDVLHAYSVGMHEEGFNLVACQGTAVTSPMHIYKIMQSSPSTVYLFGDNDSPGWAGAAKSKKSIDVIHEDVRSFVAPKDPKKMSLQEMLSLVLSVPKRGLRTNNISKNRLLDFGE